MPKVIVTHGVADVETWLQFKSERADAIGSLGGRNVVDHVPGDGGSTVAVSLEVDDVAALQAALSSPSPEVLAVMQRHGVIPPPAVFVEG